MSYHAKIWDVYEPAQGEVQELTARAGVSNRVAGLLLERGLESSEEIRSFLQPRLKDLKSPFTLKGMRPAVDRLIRSLENEEKVVVWGDYDVDGVTSTALLLRYFRDVGHPIGFFVPNRLKDGYGLNLHHIERLASEGVAVVITVDCGISNVKEVARANELGLDVIIVDHHEVPATLPDAHSIIDPLQPGCEYGCTWMAAVGLTFHLLMALRAEMRGMGYFTDGAVEPDLRTYLDVTAVGTIADLAPLKGVNRILTKAGIQGLRQTRSLGLKALIDVSMGSRTRALDAGFVGFQMGPRINAAGRLSSASQGVEMLTSESYQDAYEIAVAVDQENLLRREIQDQMIEEAMVMMKERVHDGLRAGYVLWSDTWHPGVAGIVASRLVEEFHRPFFVVAMDGEVGKGSGRSISGFHMVRALGEMEESLLNYGGHAHAAGVSIERAQLESFSRGFEAIAQRDLEEDRLIPRLSIHGSLPLEEVDGDLMDELEGMEPFGMGNRKPVFFARQVRVQRTRVVKGNHLQLWIEQDGLVFQGIAFGRGDAVPENGELLSIAFFPEWNEWKGQRKIQLHIKDFRPAD